MQPIFGYTFLFACAAGAAAFLPGGWRGGAWCGLGLAYAGLLTWGVVSMRSGLFGPAVTHGDPARPEVALTYDDGPDPDATCALLDLLRDRGVPATFFVVGARARAHPEVVRRCHAEGHLVGNHTDRHSHLTNFFLGPFIRRELRACQETVERITGVAPRAYRPPVGLVNPLTEPVARSLGMKLVGWQVRSLDTRLRRPEDVVRRVLDRVRPGGIVLLHDGGQDPARVREITRRILDGLEQRGLQPVRLDRIVADAGPQA